MTLQQISRKEPQSPHVVVGEISQSKFSESSDVPGSQISIGIKKGRLLLSVNLSLASGKPFIVGFAIAYWIGFWPTPEAMTFRNVSFEAIPAVRVLGSREETTIPSGARCAIPNNVKSQKCKLQESVQLTPDPKRVTGSCDSFETLRVNGECSFVKYIFSTD